MKVKRAKTSFATATGGGLAEGTIVPENHPFVKDLPGLFEDVDDYFAREFPELQASAVPKRPAPSTPVEQATATPGQRRSVRRSVDPKATDSEENEQ